MQVKSQSEVSQSCPTLSDPMDCSLLGSSAHGIFQAKVLDWVAIAFSVTIIEEPYFQILEGFSGGSGEGNGKPFQYACLDNPMDGGAW